MKIEGLISSCGDPWGYYALGEHDPKEFMEAVAKEDGMDLDEIGFNEKDVIVGWYKLIPYCDDDVEYDRKWTLAEENDSEAFKATFAQIG